MEGMLCSWALSLQEFDNRVEGTVNADALSHYHSDANQPQPVAASGGYDRSQTNTTC